AARTRPVAGSPSAEDFLLPVAVELSSEAATICCSCGDGSLSGAGRSELRDSIPWETSLMSTWEFQYSQLLSTETLAAINFYSYLHAVELLPHHVHLCQLSNEVFVPPRSLARLFH